MPYLFLQVSLLCSWSYSCRSDDASPRHWKTRVRAVVTALDECFVWKLAPPFLRCFSECFCFCLCFPFRCYVTASIGACAVTVSLVSPRPHRHVLSLATTPPQCPARYLKGPSPFLDARHCREQVRYSPFCCVNGDARALVIYDCPAEPISAATSVGAVGAEEFFMLFSRFACVSIFKAKGFWYLA